MSTLQVNTIQTNTPAGVLAVRDVNNALTSIQPSALRGTASATAPVFQDSAGTQIGTLCRAWVNFDGTGTPAIRGAFNVSTITDFGVGSYGVNLITPMPDVNYSVVATAGYRGSGSFEKVVCNLRLTNRCDVAVADVAATDVPYVGVAVFK
jgi:hypothetical protein